MRSRALHEVSEGWRGEIPHSVRVEFVQARVRAAEGSASIGAAPTGAAPISTETRLAKPWRMVTVPRWRLEALHAHDYPAAIGHMKMWHVGECRPVANCNPLDIFPAAPDLAIMSQRPGRGPRRGRFDDVLRGPYGIREFKYLWVLDHGGIHIVRELSSCKFSARGIATHSMMVDRGILGGEIFFDPDDSGKIYVNFGSARLPIESTAQAERCAEIFLALGYETVVAMIPDRDLENCRYGMNDRYGSNVQNVVFKAEQDAVRDAL